MSDPVAHVWEMAIRMGRSCRDGIIGLKDGTFL